MQTLLFRRTLRQLKANGFRYLALFLLIVFAMGIVIGVVGSAESVIRTVNRKAEANGLEDGQFALFVPLTEAQQADIENMGISLEASFSLDFSMEDGSTLRVMKNRESINRVEIDSGRPAESEHEIVLERLYAAAHGLSVGDLVSVAGLEFTVCGIGSTADYDLCLQNMADMAADGSVFGTAFVTESAYETALKDSGQALHTEDYRYSYRLGGGASHVQLKDYLTALSVTPGEVQDIFFQEMAARETGDRDKLSDGIAELVDGSRAMDEALTELDNGASELQAGIQAVYDGLSQLHSNSGTLNNASGQILEALGQLEAGSAALDFSLADIRALRDASASLSAAADELAQGLDALSAGVSYEGFLLLLQNALISSGIDPAALSPDAQAVLAVVQPYLNELSAGLVSASGGAAGLRQGLEQFDAAVAVLPDAMEALHAGIQQLSAALSLLRAEYANMDEGISAYTGGLDKIYEGFAQIERGADALSAATSSLSESSGQFLSGMSSLQEETQRMLEEYFPLETENLIDFVPAGDNPRIKAANGDVEINIKVGIMAGVLVMILIAYVISIFTVHSIDQESSIIGALYALGLKPKQLMLHYTMLPAALCLAGGIAGTLLGYSRPMLAQMAGESINYFSIPAVEPYHDPFLLLYGLLLPPLAAFLISWVIIRRRLNRPALSLLRKEASAGRISKSSLSHLRFPRAFQLRQLLRERRSCLAVLAGIFLSLMILILGLNCYVLCVKIQRQNIADTQYEYMYLLKYPESSVPEGGYAAYVEGLKKENLGYNMEVSVIGLEEGNPFFPAIASSRKNEVSISSSVAAKFGLKAGDELLLRDDLSETVYAFTVTEIIPYSPGLCVFMDIDGMRSLFQREENYYNALYSDHALELDAGRLYAVATKADVEKSASIFIEIMIPLVVTMVGASILIFLIVLYQMTKVMVDRASVSISLMKIFGYREREIRRLYLDASFWVVAVGTLFLLPLAKLLMDAVYPAFVANVACGTDFSWPPLLYAATYLGTLLCYLFIRTLLMGRLKKLTAAEILKNRE